MMALLIHIDVLSLISLIVGVLSLIIAIILYYKGKKIKSPVYLSRTTRLINRSFDQIDKLEIKYDDVKLSALTITKLAFWNKGRETIQSDDLTPKDQLRIEINNEYKILSCDILAQTKIANDFKVEITEDKKAIIISFDYLDYQDGVVLKIRHTGSDSNDLAMKGGIKGASIKEVGLPDKILKYLENTSGLLSMALTLFVFAVALFDYKHFSLTLLTIYLCIFFASSVLYIFTRIRRESDPWDYSVPKALTPVFRSWDF